MSVPLVHVHHVGVAAADPDASVRFYVALLHGILERAGGHTVVRAGDVRIAIAPRRPDDPPGHAWAAHLALACDADARSAWIARLDALGAAYQEVHGRLYLRDPDGYTLELLFGAT